MAALAAIILAHNDAPKVRRLIGTLAGTDVFLHCDRRTDDRVARAMTEGVTGVTLVPRRATRIATWSVAAAELRGVSLALERSAAEHIVVMSGACYPLASMEAITAELAAWRGRSRLELNPIPYRSWNRRASAEGDGGMWRFERRFLSVRGSVLAYRDMPFPIPLVRRRPPETLSLTASAHWKIYARAHATRVLEVLDADRALLDFWRSTWSPEESAVASILQSRALVGDVVDEVIDDLPWYMQWGASPHPAWLGEGDFPRLRAAATAPARPVDVPRVPDRTVFRKPFARKIPSSAGALLDRIDEELRR